MSVWLRQVEPVNLGFIAGVCRAWRLSVGEIGASVLAPLWSGTGDEVEDVLGAPKAFGVSFAHDCLLSPCVMGRPVDLILVEGAQRVCFGDHRIFNQLRSEAMQRALQAPPSCLPRQHFDEPARAISRADCMILHLPRLQLDRWFRLDLCEAAIGCELSAGHVRCFRRSEERDDVGDLGWFCEPAEWRCARNVLSKAIERRSV